MPSILSCNLFNHQARFCLFLVLILSLFSNLLTSVTSTAAQGDQGESPAWTTYDNPDFGIRFDLPADWEVSITGNQLMAGSPADLALHQAFQPSNGLVLLVNIGSYNTMGVQNAGQLADQMAHFVPAGINSTPPTPVSYGDSSGFAVEFNLPETPIFTRLTLLTAPGARLATVRVFTPASYWITEGRVMYERIMTSLTIYLPSHMANPLDSLPDNDGGVLWHYQSAQGDDAPTVVLGGLTYDQFGVMYVAAGPRGILALNQNTGEFVNYLGPLFDDDNLADVAIGPQDALLYFANASPGLNNRIMVTDRLGKYVRGWGVEGDGPGEFAPGMPQTIAVTRRGHVWVVSEGHAVEPRDRLYRFDSFGNLLSQINLVDVNPELRFIRLDNNVLTDGLFLVGQRGGLNILDSDGSLLVPNVAKELLTDAVPLDIAIGPEGLIVVATQNVGFLQFTNLGELVDRFGWKYDETRGGRFQPGEYFAPKGMVISPDGVIYFTETHRQTRFSQIQAFRFSGAGNLALPSRPIETDGGTTQVTTAAGGVIEYGNTVRGVIDNRVPVHEYRFRGVAGDVITITMRDVSTQNSLDTLLVLLDANRNELVRVDDIGRESENLRATDSLIQFTIGITGEFIIQATRFGGSGDYEMTLERAQ
jgi:hypothetical protein